MAPPAAAAAPAEVELAPDPRLAPAIPLAPAPAALAESEPVQPDVPLDDGRSAALFPLFDVRLGFRDQLIGTDSYDSFSEDDQLPGFHLAAGVRLHDLASGGALSGVASLELSGTSASLRGQPSELDVLRVGLGPELRLPLGERVFVAGTLSPQAVRVSTRVDQSQLTNMSFTQEQWTFGIDASVGAGVRLAQVRPAGLEQPVGGFLRVEAGYAWSPSMDLELSAGSGGPVRSAALPLGDLSLHGFSFGAGLGVGY